MTSLGELRFFATAEHDCSYLKGQQAVTLFADSLAEVDTDLYSSLSAMGFRRSGPRIYRPFCQTCSACIPLRIPVGSFVPRRRQKRVVKRNDDLVMTAKRPSLTEEYFAVYRRYIDKRHSDGDMHPASREQFEAFLVDGRPETLFYDFRAGDRLLAVAVADHLNDGLSAIYTFFEPEAQGRSPGVFMILSLIRETQRLGLDYLYLGYWIRQCRKMNYKIDYKPVELYIDNRWIGIEDEFRHNARHFSSRHRAVTTTEPSGQADPSTEN